MKTIAVISVTAMHTPEVASESAVLGADTFRHKLAAYYSMQSDSLRRQIGTYSKKRDKDAAEIRATLFDAIAKELRAIDIRPDIPDNPINVTFI